MYALLDEQNDWYAVTDDPKIELPNGHRLIPRDEAITYSRSYIEPVVPVVPESITRTQGRLALHRAGLLTLVESAVAASGVEASIVYESAVWRRANPLIQSLGAAIGMTDSQIDNLFVAAGAIE